jgi:hypothetical protein
VAIRSHFEQQFKDLVRAVYVLLLEILGCGRIPNLSSFEMVVFDRAASDFIEGNPLLTF